MYLFHFTVVLIDLLLKLPIITRFLYGHSVKGVPFCRRLIRVGIKRFNTDMVTLLKLFGII